MKAVNAKPAFKSLSDNVGQFDPREKIFLLPEMSKISCQLLAATFRSFSVRAEVLETYRGLDIGKEFTSGKECFPCQITTGDILNHMNKEKERLGEKFDPNQYIYFMPEATGPCRFGMYNKYQRIVLDSFPDLKDLKIGSLTTGNAYSLEGMFERKKALRFRKVAYLSVIAGDVLDRLLWRIRPYEKEKGLAESFIDVATETMVQAFEKYGAAMAFDEIVETLLEITESGRSVIDNDISQKPLIGIVGEIYMRTHREANQDVGKMLEKYGAEIVISSLTEWVDFTAYENARTAKRKLLLGIRQFKFNKFKQNLNNYINSIGKLNYQEFRQHKVYQSLNKVVELSKPHRVSHLEHILRKDNLFTFDIGTEAGLSIAGIMAFANEGFSGVVNIYPFTCMPGTITSAIVRPIMNRMKIPYLDAPFDGTSHPGFEATVRTFMYQALQKFEKGGIS